MREKLVHDIKKKFGHVWGSKKLKEQRQEIITNALDRYDGEIQNGATEQNAYKAAIGSLGDIRALRKDNNCKRRFVKILLIVVFALLSACLLAVAALNGLVLIPVVVALALIWVGAFRLAKKKYYSKKPCVASIVSGGVILLLCSLPLIIGTASLDLACYVQAHPSRYDYTDLTEHVESVSYVKITKVDQYAPEHQSDVLEYTVYETIDLNEASAILEDFSKLKYYSSFGHSRSIHEGMCGFLIIFRDDCPDVACLLYCQNGFAVVKRTGDGIDVDGDMLKCNEKKWNAILNSYLQQDIAFYD